MKFWIVHSASALERRKSRIRNIAFAKPRHEKYQARMTHLALVRKRTLMVMGIYRHLEGRRHNTNKITTTTATIWPRNNQQNLTAQNMSSQILSQTPVKFPVYDRLSSLHSSTLVMGLAPTLLSPPLPTPYSSPPPPPYSSPSRANRLSILLTRNNQQTSPPAPSG